MRCLLEDQRGPLRGDSVELLLLSDEVDLGLLHGVASCGHHCLLVSRCHWRLELEGRLAYRLDEAEALVLIAGRHRRDSRSEHMVAHLGRLVGRALLHDGVLSRCVLVSLRHRRASIRLRTVPLFSLTLRDAVVVPDYFVWHVEGVFLGKHMIHILTSAFPLLK